MQKIGVDMYIIDIIVCSTLSIAERFLPAEGVGEAVSEGERHHLDVREGDTDKSG